jgi:hypothetical protein
LAEEQSACGGCRKIADGQQSPASRVIRGENRSREQRRLKQSQEVFVSMTAMSAMTRDVGDPSEC